MTKHSTAQEEGKSRIVEKSPPPGVRHMPKYKQEIFRKLRERQSYENTVLKVGNDRR